MPYGRLSILSRFYFSYLLFQITTFRKSVDNLFQQLNNFINNLDGSLLFIRALKLAAGNLLEPVLRSLVVDGAADRLSGAQDFPHDSSEVDGV